VEKALIHEVERQYQKWLEDGKTIRRTQDDAGLERHRGGHQAPAREGDGRRLPLLPEPDLVPVVVDAAWLDRIRGSIGELPAARRQAVRAEYGLSAYDANVLVEQGQDVADYYDAIAKATGEFKLASNWIPAGRAALSSRRRR
jgi:aspartyl-tRNA(Asn)/glutamyl-tRNA(Gln) amidotransferase subunit B